MLKYIGHCLTVKYAIVLALFQTKNMNMDNNIFLPFRATKKFIWFANNNLNQL
jgi:hypothetical protein